MTEITIDNYESFLLDYLEGSLDAVVVSELLLFLEQHPEIKDQIEDFESFSLPLTSELLWEKERLKKTIEDDYESLILAKIEGQITTEESDILEVLVKNNREIELLQKRYEHTVLLPIDVPFPNKGKLKKATPRVLWLTPLVAAACAIYFIVQVEVVRTYSPLTLKTEILPQVETKNLVKEKNITEPIDTDAKEPSKEGYSTILKREVAFRAAILPPNIASDLVVSVEPILVLEKTELMWPNIKDDAEENLAKVSETISVRQFLNNKMRKILFKEKETNYNDIHKEDVIAAIPVKPLQLREEGVRIKFGPIEYIKN